MKIDRSNYEIWLIDYLDGNLDSDDIIILKNFLNENPDLEREINFTEQGNTTPGEEKYPFKSSLIKNASDLSDEQFTYLCIAYSEHDLSKSQSEELLEIVAANPLRAKTFSFINRIKLTPPEIKYIGKSMLKKHFVRKIPVYRIVLTGLSVAASIAFFFFLFNSLYEKKSSDVPIIVKTELQVPQAQKDSNNVTNNIVSQQSVKRIIPGNNINKVNAQLNKTYENIFPEPEVQEIASLNIKDTTLLRPASNNVFYNIFPSFVSPIQIETLLAINNRTETNEIIEEPKGLKSYFTALFRNTILKKEKTEIGPLTGYEIADAGINGLNKVFGWEMSLEKMTDKNGDLSSFVFSSKLIKFNAPVKKLMAEK
jgi:hypothetical protein